VRKRLWLLPSLAAAAIASGCGSRNQGHTEGWQTCVDRNNVVVDEARCQEEQRRPSMSGALPLYLWYYYPFRSTIYPLGYGAPTGGYYSREPYAGVGTRSMGVPQLGAAAPSPRANVTRGGFGSSASQPSVGG
jgi:hypothetical protein